MSTPKFTLQIDRLTVTLQLNTRKVFSLRYIIENCPFRGNSYTLSPALELRKSAKRVDKFYLHSFEVWAEGHHVGTLHTDSRLPQSQKLAKFEVSQRVLYTSPGFTHHLAQLAAAGLHVEAVSYVEIALDTQLQKPLLPRLSRMERHSTLDKYNPAPKYRPLRVKTVCNKLVNGSEYTFGHGANKTTGSGKQVAVYCKSDELAQADSTKSYITDYHQANGLDIQKPVERIEARISSRWFAANHLAIGTPELADQDTLRSLFIQAVGDAFRFVSTDTTAPTVRSASGHYAPAVTDLLPLAWLDAQPVELPRRWLVGEAEEISDQRNRIACGVLVHGYVANGTPEAQASLEHFLSTTPAPARSAWPTLVERYAQGFEGRPTAANKERIAGISALLHPILTSMVN